MQKLRELWDRIRLVLVAVLTALVLMFALQNLHAVRMDVVFWQVEYSASLLVLVSFLAGLLVGGVTTFYYKGRFSKEKQARRKAVEAAAVAAEKIAEVEKEAEVKALPAETAPEAAQPAAEPEPAEKREPPAPRPPPGGRR
jgi:uncharacterized integral membrane protein